MSFTDLVSSWVDWLILAAVALILLAVLAYGIAQPYYEAKTFNRCTHSSATYWDALWADLRVFECKP